MEQARTCCQTRWFRPSLRIHSQIAAEGSCAPQCCAHSVLIGGAPQPESSPDSCRRICRRYKQSLPALYMWPLSGKISDNHVPAQPAALHNFSVKLAVAFPLITQLVSPFIRRILAGEEGGCPKALGHPPSSPASILRMNGETS